MPFQDQGPLHRLLDLAKYTGSEVWVFGRRVLGENEARCNHLLSRAKLGLSDRRDLGSRKRTFEYAIEVRGAPTEVSAMWRGARYLHEWRPGRKRRTRPHRAGESEDYISFADHSRERHPFK